MTVDEDLPGFGYAVLIMSVLSTLRTTGVQNGVQTAPWLSSALKIAEQCKYIIAWLFDSRRPTTILQCTLTLMSCLGLDQSILVKLQGH